jgi:hypothetical protein
MISYLISFSLSVSLLSLSLRLSPYASSNVQVGNIWAVKFESMPLAVTVTPLVLTASPFESAFQLVISAILPTTQTDDHEVDVKTELVHER